MPRQMEFNQNLEPTSTGSACTQRCAAELCGAEDRQALEQLCRYITRPAVANERVQTNAAGQVVLKLKTPWRDGTTHLGMSTLEFMQRLAATRYGKTGGRYSSVRAKSHSMNSTTGRWRRSCRKV